MIDRGAIERRERELGLARGPPARGWGCRTCGTVGLRPLSLYCSNPACPNHGGPKR